MVGWEEAESRIHVHYGQAPATGPVSKRKAGRCEAMGAVGLRESREARQRSHDENDRLLP